MTKSQQHATRCNQTSSRCNRIRINFKSLCEFAFACAVQLWVTDFYHGGERENNPPTLPPLHRFGLSSGLSSRDRQLDGSLFQGLHINVPSVDMVVSGGMPRVDVQSWQEYPLPAFDAEAALAAHSDALPAPPPAYGTVAVPLPKEGALEMPFRTCVVERTDVCEFAALARYVHTDCAWEIR